MQHFEGSEREYQCWGHRYLKSDSRYAAALHDEKKNDTKKSESCKNKLLTMMSPSITDKLLQIQRTLKKESKHPPTAQRNTTKHSFAPLKHLFLNNNGALILYQRMAYPHQWKLNGSGNSNPCLKIIPSKAMATKNRSLKSCSPDFRQVLCTPKLVAILVSANVFKRAFSQGSSSMVELFRDHSA